MSDAPESTSSGSLQAELDYDAPTPNAFQRAMQRTASSRAGSWFFQRTLYRIDRPLYRWSNGRISVPGITTGLPVIMLTTTGARSGEPRTMPLAPIPFRGDLAVLGTNYAQQRTPGWVHNLEADPSATVTWGDRTVDVVAEPLDDEDREALWGDAARVYVGFGKYRERIADREVRMFRLRLAD